MRVRVLGKRVIEASGNKIAENCESEQNANSMLVCVVDSGIIYSAISLSST